MYKQSCSLAPRAPRVGGQKKSQKKKSQRAPCSGGRSSESYYDSIIDSFRQVVIDKLGVSCAIDELSPFMVAVQNDDRELATALINAKADQNRVTSRKWSALRCAIRRGCVNITQLLISRGCNVSIDQIIEAASLGHQAVVKVLVNRYNQENGRSLLHLLPKRLPSDKFPSSRVAVDILVSECASEINEAGTDGHTPISRAISASSFYLVSALIKAGANFPKEHAPHPVLLELLRRGHNDAAKMILSKAPHDISKAVDSDGSTALHLAGTAELVESLLELGCDPNAVNRRQRTPLSYAKNTDIANKLLDARANIDHQDMSGSSPLMWTQDKEVAATLLQRKADVARDGVRRNADTQTLLMKAAQWTNLDLVKSLLELPRAKKAINARDCNFCTAVTYATKQQSPGTIEVVKALLDAGANVNVDDGKSPLHVATDCNVIRLLVDAGADMDMTDEHGFPPLYYRCADGDTDAFKLLLSLGACVDVDGDMGMEILSLTLHDNRVDMMNALLPYLTDLRGDPDHIGSPVFEAARRSYSRAACAFLAAWGWEDVTDDDGQTALMVCCGTEVAQQLLDGGVRVDDEDDLGRTALHHACLLGSDEMVSFLLKNGADPSALDSESKTPLRLACENKRLRAVIALLSAKHSSMEWIDEYCEDDSTALHIAVKKDYCEIVACLLAAGAKQIPDGDGNMPLHLAKSSHVVRMLLEAGAKDVKDRSGYTALMHACKGNNSVIVQLLSDPKYGCDVNAVNNGETALSLAFQHSSLDASPVLLSSPLLDANQRVDESGRTVTPKRRKM